MNIYASLKIAERAAAGWIGHRQALMTTVEVLSGHKIPEGCMDLIKLVYAAGFADGMIDAATEPDYESLDDYLEEMRMGGETR